MMVARSREAASGVRFVQKYSSAFRPTTGIPSEARTLEIPRSIAAHPPSPETKTTSVSELPFVAGTSTSGRRGVAADAALAEVSSKRRIAYFIRGERWNSVGRWGIRLIQQLNPPGHRLRCRGGWRAGVDDVGEEEGRVGLLVGSEADDEVPLRLGGGFVGVAPGVVQQGR